MMPKNREHRKNQGSLTLEQVLIIVLIVGFIAFLILRN